MKLVSLIRIGCRPSEKFTPDTERKVGVLSGIEWQKTSAFIGRNPAGRRAQNQELCGLLQRDAFKTAEASRPRIPALSFAFNMRRTSLITAGMTKWNVMEVRPVKQTIEHFKDLLNGTTCTESAFQSFLEKEPAFLLTPFLLNHHLHDSAVISQFRLNTSLTADFAYLTKSSIQWRLVLIEIERPDIRLFLSTAEQVTPTAEFTRRLAQIHEWKDEVRRDPKMVFRTLEPLRRPLERNAIDVRFLLIIGRSGQHVSNQRQADRLLHIGGDDLQISVSIT